MGIIIKKPKEVLHKDRYEDKTKLTMPIIFLILFVISIGILYWLLATKCTSYIASVGSYTGCI